MGASTFANNIGTSPGPQGATGPAGPNHLVVPTGQTAFLSKTATIDFTAAAANYAFDLATVNGKSLVILGTRLVLLTRDATLTTGLTYDYGQNNASVSVAGAVAITTASLNAAAAPINLFLSQVSMKAVDITTNMLQFMVTVPVSGAGLTTCTGYVEVFGYYA